MLKKLFFGISLIEARKHRYNKDGGTWEKLQASKEGKIEKFWVYTIV